jgi:uncharacterized membrane protein YhaH (DUF805 family)
MKEFLTVFRRWNDFSGRSSRREYWMFTLVLLIIAFVLGVLDGVMLGVMDYSQGETEAQFLTLGNAYSLVTLIPSISVSVRRLHDIDKSGWWLLLCLTGIGILLIIYWACLDSDEDENRYGSLVLPDQDPPNVE